jgi:hypothetical protein
MPMLRKVRLISAIALLGAIVLPLSECQRSHIDKPIPKSVSQQLFPRDNTDFLYFYAYKALGSPLGGGLTVLAFAWPLVFVLFVRRRLGSRSRFFFQLLEVLLCAGTIYCVKSLAIGDRWLYGAYVAVAAVSCFTCAGLASWLERSLTRRSSQPLTGEKICT